jgi:hypothetical protein
MRTQSNLSINQRPTNCVWMGEQVSVCKVYEVMTNLCWPVIDNIDNLIDAQICF